MSVEKVDRGQKLSKVRASLRLRQLDGHESRVVGHRNECVRGRNDECEEVDNVGVRVFAESADAPVEHTEKSESGHRRDGRNSSLELGPQGPHSCGGSRVLRTVDELDCDLGVGRRIRFGTAPPNRSL
mgnify:FL=1